jgi:hypothetical protein
MRTKLEWGGGGGWCGGVLRSYVERRADSGMLGWGTIGGEQLFGSIFNDSVQESTPSMQEFVSFLSYDLDIMY